MSSITVSLIIAVYNRADFLELVLQSVARQTYRDLEVIIAEDGQFDEIKTLILARQGDFPFPIKHVSHEDRGFRKNKILNEALKVSKGDYIVFIDGDCLLHKKFIEQHVRNAKPRQCLFGRRAMLGQKTTANLMATGKLTELSFLSLLFGSTRHLEDAFYLPWLSSARKTGVKGSNFSVNRDLIFQINGFDEDFEKPYGGEDSDVERRLCLIGASIVCTKFKTIQYHLYHGGREGRDDDWEQNGRKFYSQKAESGEWYCRNGLVKHENPS